MAVENSAPSPDPWHSLLTERELAARWRLSPGTLANQRSQGRGASYLKLSGSGAVRYRLADVLAYEDGAAVVPGGAA
ncbi:helix-turn-helix transcriptional regulator [Cellulomonas xiejunii]|uniref:helix-turn-helix transcriptional regulator n=1 Tax=Cellulomonas xiejunii TaxID=2968083 RepID=UPI001D0E1F6A|nr:DNA-binding protein [Cellulomonas xiejunii]MCC2321941.1 DNA-binding protein [Cellulomonas xiejunii]